MRRLWNGGGGEPVRSWLGRLAAELLAARALPMDDPRFQHLSREAAARGRAPGWRAEPPGAPSRLFSDADHGSPGAALDAAIAWRDGEAARVTVPLPDAPVTLAPGIYLTTQPGRARRYPVVKAIADDADGKRQTLVRSLIKHAPQDAIREAAEHRIRHRGAAAGPVADLYAEALAAYAAHAAS